ncbi:hypothetical protein [Sphingomonas glacialis]|uniref:Uncharacterized protein n=1 Tax=Sphingomonas glacialis TaxID=658225 RepID=A0A502FRB5_9SPHN|nr:hypothetical protein [Sphingomonas glacialis]TPG51960.1 hypothetical protein EAH76_14585 [Sphingomonas glacialis]
MSSKSCTAEWRAGAHRAPPSRISAERSATSICLDKLAAHYDIDLAEATLVKFNATLDKVALPHRLPTPTALTSGNRSTHSLRRS